jgi:hypothetical protein
MWSVSLSSHVVAGRVPQPAGRRKAVRHPALMGLDQSLMIGSAGSSREVSAIRRLGRST